MEALSTRAGREARSWSLPSRPTPVRQVTHHTPGPQRRSPAAGQRSPGLLSAGGDVTALVRTGRFMSDMFQSGALTCLICISSVRRSQAVRQGHRGGQGDTKTGGQREREQNTETDTHTLSHTRSALPLCVQVWSCSSCFSLFHLPCIQKWARDSAFLVSSVTDEDFGRRRWPWPWSVAFTAADSCSDAK